MSIHRAGQLGLWGFSVLSTGIMAILVAVNVPGFSAFLKPIVLTLSAVTLAGLVAMLVGILSRVDERDQA